MDSYSLRGVVDAASWTTCTFSFSFTFSQTESASRLSASRLVKSTAGSDDTETVSGTDGTEFVFGVLDVDEIAPGMKESVSGRRETSSKDESASDVESDGPTFSIDESAFAVCESPSVMQGSVCGIAEPVCGIDESASGMAELGSMVEPASSMVESASGMAEPGSMVKFDSGMDKLGNMVKSAGMDAADRSTEAHESDVDETFPAMAVADSDKHKTSSVTDIFETEPDKDAARVSNETDVAGSPAVAWESESSKCPCSWCLVCLRVQAAIASFTDGLNTAEVGLLSAELGLSASCSPWSWF